MSATLVWYGSLIAALLIAEIAALMWTSGGPQDVPIEHFFHLGIGVLSGMSAVRVLIVLVYHWYRIDELEASLPAALRFEVTDLLLLMIGAFVLLALGFYEARKAFRALKLYR